MPYMPAGKYLTVNIRVEDNYPAGAAKADRNYRKSRCT